MKMTDITIFFLSIFLCLYAVIFVHTRMEDATNRANNLYAHYIATSCQDALELNILEAAEIKDNESRGLQQAWQEPSVREAAVKTFYKSFALSLNKREEGYYNEIELMTPFVFIIDVDGYYISYNAAFDPNSSSHSDYNNLHNISAINTWSENRNGYIVRYTLSDLVQVICPDGRIITDDRWDAYNKAASTDLDYFLNDESFLEEKNACIIQDMTDKMNYYVNTLNNNADAYDTQYIINLPEIKGETWCGLIDKPAIAGFVQGNTYNIRNQKVSVYSFGIYEMGEPLHYFVMEDLSGERIYYCYEDKKMTGQITQVGEDRVFNGSPLKEFYTSKEDAAKSDAWPEIY